MSYTPTIWQNSPSTATPISADNLNHIEQGIADLDDQLNGANGIAQELQTAESDIQSLDENKVSKEEGKDLSSNDFTDDDVAKLDGIEAGAEVNVQSDYAQEDNTADDYIKNKPMAVEKSATSSFKTINGGVLTKCVVDLEPIQDLHGYDYPWVGGAGKNKLPLVLADIKSANTSGTWSGNVYTYRGITYTINTDNDGNVIEIDADGTSSADYAMLVIANNVPITQGSYYVNGITGGSNSTIRFELDISGGDYKTISDGDNLVQISADTTYRLYVDVRYSGVTVNHFKVYPMIRLSTETDATFASYTNYCSISGHTEVDVKRDGKNLCTKQNVNNTVVASVKANETYTFSCINNDDCGVNLKVNDTNGATLAGTNGSTTVNPIVLTFTPTIDCDIYLNGHSGFVTETSNWQLEKGSTATPYEPYKGELKVINLNGTYYGVRGDAVSGEWEVVSVIVDLGTLTWGRNSTAESGKYRFTATATPLPKPSASNSSIPNILCSQYKAVSPSTTYSPSQGISISTSSTILVYDEALSTSSASDFATAMDGVQLVYELATPIPLSLTPTQIESLVGINYIDAPLDGQSIETDGVGYKELFGWDDVVNYVQSVINA